jgi:hypothetical protein
MLFRGTPQGLLNSRFPQLKRFWPFFSQLSFSLANGCFSYTQVACNFDLLHLSGFQQSNRFCSPLSLLFSRQVFRLPCHIPVLTHLNVNKDQTAQPIECFLPDEKWARLCPCPFCQFGLAL